MIRLPGETDILLADAARLFHRVRHCRDIRPGPALIAEAEAWLARYEDPPTLEHEPILPQLAPEADGRISSRRT